MRSDDRKKSVMVLLGTRPEAIKLAPVVHELRRRSGSFRCWLYSSGQHDEMLSQALGAFELSPDRELGVIRSNQSLAGLTSRLFAAVDRELEAVRPDWLLVQGDTTTAYVGSMCAFYRRINVAHVEAGLRTGNRWTPFPEEVNRSIISKVADIHFAPTERAARNLVQEGVLEPSVVVTGNTAVDALLWARSRVGAGIPPGLVDSLASLADQQRLILVTGHRRESFGRGLQEICAALREITDRFEDVLVVYPVHLNPQVRGPVHKLLDEHPRIRLLEPVGYLEMVWLMARAHLILTDSGGIQEEAPTLQKPVLVMRGTTERPEAVEAGCARLVGNHSGSIVSHATDLLASRVVYESLIGHANPFGDGKAAVRIANALEDFERTG
jgi:UDP-N-acetylglucosamine 2-epimerase (non-hydrolysing)